MSQLLAKRDAIISLLRADARLTGVNVYDHGGEFTEKDLEHYSKKAPALIVALLGAEPSCEGGSVVATAAWCFVLITRDSASRRDRSAIALADAVMRVLAGSFVGASASSGPLRDVRARNLFGPRIDSAGVAMWSMVATQRIELLDDTSTAVDLTSIHATWADVSPATPPTADETLAQDVVDTA